MTAPFKGVARADYFRFQLGAFEIVPVLEGFVRREGLHPMFGANASSDQVSALAQANRLPTDGLEHGMAPVLVNTGRELVLFDTGFGESRRAEGFGQLIPRMALAGYRPQDVDIVVITHGHPDHFCGLLEGGKPAFSNAAHVFGRVDFDYWNKGENIPPFRQETLKLYREFALPMADRATFIEPGQDVVPGITAVEAYGHSAGHMAYHVESNGQRLLIMADSLLHFVFTVQRPDWHVFFDDDKDKAAATRARILDMVATEQLWAAGFHMPFPGLGFIERAGNGYRWAPLSYQLTY